MALNTTGAEFKRFYNDDVYWPQEGEAWHEDVELLVNDEKWNADAAYDTIPDQAKVKIVAGMMLGTKFDGKDVTFETYFKRWRKQQSRATVLVECDASKLQAIKDAVKEAGGRLVA